MYTSSPQINQRALRIVLGWTNLTPKARKNVQIKTFTEWLLLLSVNTEL